MAESLDGEVCDFEVHFSDGHVQGVGVIWQVEVGGDVDTGRADVHIELIAKGIVIHGDGATPLAPGRYLVCDDGFWRLSRVLSFVP